MVIPKSIIVLLICVIALPLSHAKNENKSSSIDLLTRYPTTLISEDTENPRKWELSKEDIYSLNSFSFSVGKTFKVDIAAADVGIGHCTDGAVWAVIIPQEKGTIKWTEDKEPEKIAHLWLRFHPAQISNIFPKNTIKCIGNQTLWMQMQKIANLKIFSSWQGGGLALIPGQKDLTVDADTTEKIRRFFIVDTIANKATYVSAFEKRVVPEDKPFTKEDAESSFDKLWQEYDRNYAMFMIRPDVDWGKLREQYRPEAIESKTAYDFAVICAKMLANLRDLHIWVTVQGQNMPVFNRPREKNSNQKTFQSIIGKLDSTNKNIVWGKTADKIGFIAINNWIENVDDIFDDVLENMRDTRGLVLDVRLNGGGSEPLAQNVAGRFADKEYVYAYSQFRKGPKHTDLTEKYPRSVKPRGPWRYDRPVVVLIGQMCMSSNESFVSMLAQCPQVTTFGDHTCGSSGNPKFVELSGGVKVSLPQWIDFLPDGTPLDEKGIKPDIAFSANPESFKANRDDLLSASVERLKKEPLPQEAIKGKSIQSIRNKLDANAPHVVSIWPTDGTSEVDPNTEIRIMFDRPMNPALIGLDWEEGKCLKYNGFTYDDKKNEFIIKVKLEDGCEHKILLQSGRFANFRAKSGETMSGDYSWGFKTKNISQHTDLNKPKLISVMPASGSELPLLALLQIKFDLPMDPNSDIYSVTRQQWLAGYQILTHQIDYDIKSKTFSIPIVLQPGWQDTIEMTGFVSTQGIEADPIKLKYSAGKQLISSSISERFENSNNSKELFSIFKNIKKTRSRLQILSERVVNSVSSNYHIQSWDLIFKIKNNSFYADISNIMQNPFLIGSDGKECWFYLVYGVDEIKKKLVLMPPDEPIEKDISICDPFNLMTLDVNSAINKFKPEYLGRTIYNGRECHLMRTWSVERHGNEEKPYIICSVTKWWLDAEKLLVSKIESDSGNNAGTFTFIYSDSMPDDAEFRCPQISNLKPQKEEPFGDGYDTRFIRVIDGSSNGRTSVRWGKKGPERRSSDGLN
ncbi:MAG: S41 family peptidase [Phycisphaerales bacterium]